MGPLPSGLARHQLLERGVIEVPAVGPGSTEALPAASLVSCLPAWPGWGRHQAAHRRRVGMPP